MDKSQELLQRMREEIRLELNARFRTVLEEAVADALDRATSEEGVVMPKSQTRAGRVVRYVFVADRARRLPLFVQKQTGCKTKADLRLKFPDGTVFEEGKQPVKPPK